MMRAPVLAAAAMLVVSLEGGVAAQSPSPFATSPFEFYLDLLRQQAGVPAISAAIVQNGEIVWERGLGFQNVEDRIRATPDTPYPIANLSETLAATLVLECAEQRLIGLDERAAAYGVSLPETGATVRQILSHTSSATEGFHYDPSRFGQLTQVVERCVLQPYRKTLAVRLLERLAMKDSVPGRDAVAAAVSEQNLFSESVQERYREVLERVAVSYKVDKKGRSSRSPDLTVDGLSASTGVVSTVRDLARFDAALDSTLLLRADTLAAAWTNAVGRDRPGVPTGLGWFVQRYNGQPVVWHFGLVPNGYSSLLLKLPDRQLTLILLANSDGLSSSFDLASGDVTKSLFAILFLRLFG